MFSPTTPVNSTHPKGAVRPYVLTNGWLILIALVVFSQVRVSSTPEGVGDMAPVGGVNDLERLRGVGSRYAVLLNDLGIRSIRDLCCRNPAWIKTMMESRHGLRLPLGECERWVLEAKQFHFPMH